MFPFATSSDDIDSEDEDDALPSHRTGHLELPSGLLNRVSSGLRSMMHPQHDHNGHSALSVIDSDDEESGGLAVSREDL